MHPTSAEAYRLLVVLDLHIRDMAQVAATRSGPQWVARSDGLLSAAAWIGDVANAVVRREDEALPAEALRCIGDAVQRVTRHSPSHLLEDSELASRALQDTSESIQALSLMPGDIDFPPPPKKVI